MIPTSNVSVFTGSQTEEKRVSRQSGVVQRYLKNRVVGENSSVLGGHLVWVAPAAGENSTRTDFTSLVESEGVDRAIDDNVIRIPVVDRRRVRIGSVRRLEPLASE
jgi:hypothetical protein